MREKAGGEEREGEEFEGRGSDRRRRGGEEKGRGGAAGILVEVIVPYSYCCGMLAEYLITPGKAHARYSWGRLRC